MINYLKGCITLIRGGYIVLEANGIGYEIKTGNPFAFDIDSAATVYTYMHVRDDNLELYGFKTEKERDIFLKLISVRGLGPKGALALTTAAATEEIIMAINNGDSAYLQRFPGIGPKTCQQIILDLHGKLDFSAAGAENPKIRDVKEALKTMGYNIGEIKSIEPVLRKYTDLSVNELLKEALKNLL